MARRGSIDRLDIRIMAMLERNGRITRADLSEAAGLSATPCGVRMERLEAEGYVRGYHADIDIEQLGSLHPFMVTASLLQWAPDGARQFEEIVAGIPHIVECHAVFGAVDYIMRVLATDADHCDLVLAPLRPIGIECVSLPVSRSVRAPHERSMIALLD